MALPRNTTPALTKAMLEQEINLIRKCMMTALVSGKSELAPYEPGKHPAPPIAKVAPIRVGVDRAWMEEMYEFDYDKLFQKGGLKGMTKKDYNAIVDAIGAMCDPIRGAISADGGAATRQIIEIIAAQLGLVFARDNKDFDSFRFMEALNKRLARTL